MTIVEPIAALEEHLNNFSPQVRADTLGKLLDMVGEDAFTTSPKQDLFNLHAHTFFSFNAFGYSPTALAWLAKKHGYSMIGMVDFDVLDGVDEFLAACDLLAVRGVAGVETRVFIPELASLEINSPGEPGISYTMGTGFTSSSVPGEVRPILGALRKSAQLRIEEMLARVNDSLSPIIVDHEVDLLPLSPSGNLTERHLVQAIIHGVERSQPDPLKYWREKLVLKETEVSQLDDPVSLQNLLRAKLLKRGGVGYIQPDVRTYPTIDQANQLITACGAIPCVAWLDGTSAGEEDIASLLGFLVEKGAGVVNIIPDRNWNIADAASKKKKLAKLYEVVDLAEQMDLPILVGTEMNSFGQKMVDDLAVPELQPLRKTFEAGAQFIFGHTVMQRAFGLGYQSNWAKAHYPKCAQRNVFYQQVGQFTQPGRSGIERLSRLGDQPEPGDVLKCFE